jgi:hypothetical protein
MRKASFSLATACLLTLGLTEAAPPAFPRLGVQRTVSLYGREQLPVRRPPPPVLSAGRRGRGRHGRPWGQAPAMAAMPGWAAVAERLMRRLTRLLVAIAAAALALYSATLGLYSLAVDFLRELRRAKGKRRRAGRGRKAER